MRPGLEMETPPPTKCLPGTRGSHTDGRVRIWRLSVSGIVFDPDLLCNSFIKYFGPKFEKITKIKRSDCSFSFAGFLFEENSQDSIKEATLHVQVLLFRHLNGQHFDMKYGEKESLWRDGQS